MSNKNNNNYRALLAMTSLMCSFHVVSGSLLETPEQAPQVLVQHAPLQLADKDFVFDPQRQSDQWQQYFTQQWPQLAAHKESFTHWVGFHSINPSVVLALMDMQSNIMSTTNKQVLQRPFGGLSDKQGFSEQLNDVLGKLAKSFYQIREQQERQYQSAGRLKAPQSAATQALEQLFASQPMASSQGKLERLFKTYQQRFDQSIATDNPEFESFQANAVAAPPALQLPWSLGYSWIGGGSHGYDGSSWPHSSIDYSYDWPSWGGTTWSVRSAHGGTVAVLSSCQVRVTDSSGWATTYYHMSNVNVYSGQQIGANTHLGYYASNKNQALCEGGSSTGPHLHFSLLRNGYYQSLDNVQLSNYEVNTGRYSYDSNCSYFNYRDWNNGGQTFCGWRAMYNYRPQ